MITKGWLPVWYSSIIPIDIIFRNTSSAYATRLIRRYLHSKITHTSHHSYKLTPIYVLYNYTKTFDIDWSQNTTDVWLYIMDHGGHAHSHTLQPWHHVLGNNYESFGCGDASLMGDRMTQTSVVPTPALTQDDKHDSRINTHTRIALIFNNHNTGIRDYPNKRMLHVAPVLQVRIT